MNGVVEKMVITWQKLRDAFQKLKLASAGLGTVMGTWKMKIIATLNKEVPNGLTRLHLKGSFPLHSGVERSQEK